MTSVVIPFVFIGAFTGSLVRRAPRAPTEGGAGPLPTALSLKPRGDPRHFPRHGDVRRQVYGLKNLANGPGLKS